MVVGEVGEVMVRVVVIKVALGEMRVEVVKVVEVVERVFDDLI